MVAAVHARSTAALEAARDSNPKLLIRGIGAGIGTVVGERPRER
jgi:hypothetical protein